MLKKIKGANIMPNKVSKIVVVAATVSLIGALSSFSAFAAPIVTDWNFTLESGFTSWGPAGVTGTNDNDYLTTSNDVLPLFTGGAQGLPFARAASRLSWGTSDGFGQSSLSVGAATNGHFSGSVQTNGAAQSTVQLIHTNRPVTGTFLSSASLFDVLFLDPVLPDPPYNTDPGTGALPVPALVFNFDFVETQNTAPCDVSASPVACNDILIVDVATSGFDITDNSLNQSFSYFGNDYNAKIFLEGLSVLETSACTAAGKAAGCIGLTTVENQENTFQAKLQITGQQFVPEPGILALFGLGLGGLGLMRRRRQKA